MTKTNISKSGALRGGTALSVLAVFGAGCAALVAVPSAAFAQDTAAAPEPLTGAATESPGEEILVTGSRIPQPNLNSTAPITTVTSDDIKLSGSPRIEDVLNSLPSVGASQTGGVSNAATGTAEVDLRYLGSKRTLVLVNGRRLAPGDPNSTSQAADLNMIPTSILKRVEVLTGGASSTYGADAVAGVVNFIMDDDFTGIRFDGNWSINQHHNQNPSITNDRNVRDALNTRIDAGLPGYEYPTGSSTDGRSIDGTISIGANLDDNRGHVTAYFGYRKVNAVLQNQRDFSTCGLSGTGNPTCGGSAISAEGNALIFDNAKGSTPGVSTIFTFGPNRTFNQGSTLFNFNPYNYFQRPDERYTAGAFANYEISPAIKPYLEFMFMDDRTLAQIAPSGDFGNTFTINCDNPLLGANQAEICNPDNLINGFIGNFPVAAGAGFNENPGAAPINFIDPTTGGSYNKAYFNYLRRNVEGGPRIADLKHTSYHGVIGTKGDLGKAWSYDVYYQYGKTNYTQIYRNEFSTSRLNKALDAVTDNRPGSATFGQAVCRSVLDNSDPNCLPYDIFGTPSQGSINYLNVFGVIDGKTSEQIANLNFTGQLGEMGVKTPWSDDGVSINVGGEYRKESLTLNPDSLFQAGDLTGQGAPTLPVDGNFNVKELFAEIQFPIAHDSFVYDLSINAGYRKSWYQTHAPNIVDADRKYNTDTYKFGLEFAPIRDIRFRAAYNRAARAPNIQELFAPQFVGLDGSTDPCAGHQITAAELGCIAQGLSVGASTPTNPAEQYNGLLGGNPQLNPEKATTTTFGVVLQPRFIPNFALTVDYWRIKLNGAIQGFGADTILSDCVTNTTDVANPAASCALIHRNPAGSIWLSPDGFVEDTPTNVGGIKTNGIDANASYSNQLGGLGRLSVSFIGTYLRKYITDNGLADPYDCAGYFGSVCSGNTVSSSAPMPKWRHKARATLAMQNGIGVSLQWRMVGKVQHEHNSNDDALAGAIPQLGGKIKAQQYFDLAATYTFARHYNFRVGVNNIFDNDPPLVTSSAASCPAGPCNGNTYPGTWDSLGRFIYAGVTFDF